MNLHARTKHLLDATMGLMEASSTIKGLMAGIEVHHLSGKAPPMEMVNDLKSVQDRIKATIDSFNGEGLE